MIPRERVAAVLSANNLNVDEAAIDWLLMDLEIAADCFLAPNDRGLEVIPKETATPLARAAERLLEAAAAYKLATMEEMRPVRRIRAVAQARRSMNASPGTEVRQWLWPCCKLFLESWTREATKPAGLYDWGKESDALKFLVDCCRIVDPEVTAAAILLARKNAGPDLDDDERDAAYQNEFSDKSGEDDL